MPDQKRDRLRTYPDQGLNEPARNFDDTFSGFDLLREKFAMDKDDRVRAYPNEGLKEPVRPFEKTFQKIVRRLFTK